MPSCGPQKCRSPVAAGVRPAAGLCFAAAALLLCAETAGAAPKSPTKSFTVATFNAEWLTRPKVHRKFGFKSLRGEYREKWEKPGYRDARFTTATRRVARYVARNVSADVLVFTEVGEKRDVDELRNWLEREGAGFPYVAVCACTDRSTAQHVAVLSRFELFDVEEKLPGREGYITEFDDPDAEDDTGISKGMRVRFRAAGHTFTLYAAHLVSERGGHAQDAQRIAQASILRRLTLKALEAGEHVIVAGDLNDRRGDPALRRVRGLHDIGPDLAQTGRAKYFKDPARAWTSIFKGQRELIDHILVSRSILKAVKRGKRGVRAATGPAPGKEVSDHRPLIVTLTFR